jgi:hypothetical protein
MFLFFINDDIPPIPSDWPFYCPLTPPDLTINATITIQSPTLVNYCLQTSPSLLINFVITELSTNTNYCPQNSTGYFDFSQPP